ncbi:hypothetical protein TWF696_003483 [Orbilia brochopaga]|uniref:Uncharacterized protein n=1 Tax=Orbilia brochopaga TaxID=3140254 RepID=A0AAV9TXC3_9PEZI
MGLGCGLHLFFWKRRRPVDRNGVPPEILAEHIRDYDRAIRYRYSDIDTHMHFEDLVLNMMAEKETTSDSPVPHLVRSPSREKRRLSAMTTRSVSHSRRDSNSPPPAYAAVNTTPRVNEVPTGAYGSTMIPPPHKFQPQIAPPREEKPPTVGIQFVKPAPPSPSPPLVPMFVPMQVSPLSPSHPIIGGKNANPFQPPPGFQAGTAPAPPPPRRASRRSRSYSVISAIQGHTIDEVDSEM